jgi:hypothetical protein
MKIQGKEYTEVAERVQIFKNDYPGWSMNTEMVHYEPGIRVVFKTTVYDDKQIKQSTGYAEEERGEPMLSNGKANINYDNYLEIAETSSVGRALGFIGIGIVSGIASADEVANAQNKQTAYESKEKKWWSGQGPISLYEHFIIDDIEYITMKNKTTDELFGLATDESVPQSKKFYKFV